MHMLTLPDAVFQSVRSLVSERTHAALGAAAPVALGVAGGCAAQSQLVRRSLPEPMDLYVLPWSAEGWSRPWAAIVGDLRFVAGDPPLLDAFLPLVPAVGTPLLALVALVSLGLMLLGRALDWGARPVGGLVWDRANRPLRSLGDTIRAAGEGARVRRPIVGTSAPAGAGPGTAILPGRTRHPQGVT